VVTLVQDSAPVSDAGIERQGRQDRNRRSLQSGPRRRGQRQHGTAGRLRAQEFAGVVLVQDDRQWQDVFW
jgi:hypothetical protein